MYETGTTGRRACSQWSSRPGPRLWFGLVLLVLGVLWTLDNMRFVDAGEILDWWPLVLVALGVTKLVGWGGRVRPFAGAIWILLGGLLLAHNLRYLPVGFDELWPLGLVLLGLSILWRSLRGPGAGNRIAGAGADTARAGSSVTSDATRFSGANAGVVDTETFSAIAVWAGVARRPTSQTFRGGDFTAVMGGGEIDLRGAKPVAGGCVLDLFLIMGGVEIRVPESWTVVNELSAFMGGIDDSRKAVSADGSDVLVLKGLAVMGGVEIKN
jgi:hypothetical protein